MRRWFGSRRVEKTVHPGVRPYYYLGGNRALTALADGQPFFVNTDDRSITPWIIRCGEWETHVDGVLTRLAQPGMRVCDIGANQGYYTIKLADRVGDGGHVLAIEPNVVVHHFLADNIAINGFERRVAAPRVAVGSVPGEAVLNHAGAHLGSGTLFTMRPEVDPHAQSVPVTTVDLLTAGRPGFDLVKLDVEGWEVEVVRGMRDTLARSADASIVAEVSWEAWSRFDDPHEALRTLIGTRDGLFAIDPSGRLHRIDAGEIAAVAGQRGQFYLLATPLARTGALLADILDAPA